MAIPELAAASVAAKRGGNMGSPEGSGGGIPNESDGVTDGV